MFINFILALFGWELFYFLSMEKNKWLDDYDNSSKPNYEINEYGYKFMGRLSGMSCQSKDIENYPSNVIFDGETIRLMTDEEYSNFSRERKLKYILNT